ncbi:MAG TPA: SprT-like domain-containing protein [Parasegetibacter sp.]
MAKTQAPLQALNDYLPDRAFPYVVEYLQVYKVHLTITRERKSVLGDYRNAVNNQNHRISVNGNLNAYAFLITLLHELAHLLTYDRYGHRVAPHGKEWKQQYRLIIAKFIEQDIFPQDIKETLLQSISNPAASSCADEDLIRVLRKYDKRPPGVVLVEDVPMGQSFMIPGGRVFIKEAKLRKRYRCVEKLTGKSYLFSPVYEVKLI